MKAIENLHNTLNQRKRPEDVAQMIFEILGDDLSAKEQAILKKAAKGSLKNTFFGYTSMMQEFATAVGAEKQIKKAIEIFELDNNVYVDYNDVEAIKKFIEEVAPLISKAVGANNFVADRLNKAQRKEIGLDLSKRSYNKKWRLLKRLEKKLFRYSREIKKIEFQKVGKHGLVHTITLEEFQKDLNTACFIAYYNARCNLRSVFTNTSQERAFDEISQMLLNRCKGVSTTAVPGTAKTKHEPARTLGTNWWAISHIYTSQEVLSKLSDEHKGALLGKWTGILQEVAGLLAEIWSENDFSRKTMIVKRGNDSTTWNNTASAWNKARDNWMNIIYALGMDYILDDICFGKVLRLMAADVVAWHHATGGRLDPNTDVWNKIPLPWEVFQGVAHCNKQLVVTYCKQAGIDPEKSGWMASRVHGVAAFKPTPELVHGVTVANPYLATVLKKHKYFSGKNVQPLFPESN
ncbi:MAG: hypothetical protein AAF705_08340 [Bacteroidota bacterium]